MTLLSLSLCLVLSPQEPEPLRIEWQRSLGEALLLQQATGQPLLVCVNADGEPFCERVANATYLDESFINKTRGYICVVASPDRHNERDYDSLGRRIECPRFPGCTCSEHQQIEPLLFARWFKGERYAPRHLAVDGKGAVLFDRFLDGSMQDAIDAIATHKGDTMKAPLPVDSDAMIRRPEAAARRALEKLFFKTDGKGRRQLLTRCAQAGNFPVDLLRIALRDDDEETYRAAANALAAIGVAECGIDLQDALARCDDADLAASLMGTMERLADSDAGLRRHWSHAIAAQQAVAQARALAFGTAKAPAERDQLERDLDAAEAAAKQAPLDADAQLALAKANVALALVLLPEGGSTAPLLLEDARRAAERANQMAAGKSKATAHAAQCVALWNLNLPDQAAQPAKDFCLSLTSEEALAMPLVLLVEALRVAGRSAARSVYATFAQPAGKPEASAKEPMPAEIAQATFGLCAAACSPLATEQDAREAAELLAFAGARIDAQRILRQAMQRFPWSSDLHDVARRRFLVDRGPSGLLLTYRGYESTVDDAATAAWFSGYAAIVAAEVFVADKRSKEALSAYDECVAAFAQSVEKNANYADSANHFRVLALAGSALLQHQHGKADDAVDRLIAARTLRPASMTDKDGLGREPLAILRRVQRELHGQGKTALAQRLD